MKALLSCLFASVIGLVSNSWSKEFESMGLLMEKPIFQIRFKTIDCAYILFVNGCSAHLNYYDEGQMSLELPVNQFMRSGKNELTLDVFPSGEKIVFNPSAALSAELWVKPAGKPEPSYCLGGLSFKASGLQENHGASVVMPSGKYISESDMTLSDEGEIELFDIDTMVDPQIPEGFLISRQFDIPNSLPPWGFGLGDDIPDPVPMSDDDYNAFVAELLKEYMKIQDALADGSEEAIDAVMPLFAERNRELDQAFYLEAGSTEKRLRASMLRNANDPDRTLVPLSADVIGTNRHENKKLIELCRGDESAIGFNYVPGPGSVDYDIIYYKKDGKWIISR